MISTVNINTPNDVFLPYIYRLVFIMKRHKQRRVYEHVSPPKHELYFIHLYFYRTHIDVEWMSRQDNQQLLNTVYNVSKFQNYKTVLKFTCRLIIRTRENKMPRTSICVHKE